jgi:Domain of unknown function (DUF4062)
MNKRYQVFVSSTYVDLRDERDKIYKALMSMGCIPVGMECFAAESVEQWEIIKQVIDDSDFYVLIIAGRYGTVASDGRSFTEKEFDYALSRKKPVLVFCHESPQKLPQDKADLEPEARNSLQKFRAKAMSNRMAAFWTNADELTMRVILAVYQAIETIPAEGWVRATQPPQKEPVAVQVPATNDGRKPSSHESISEPPGFCSPRQLSNKVCHLHGKHGVNDSWSIDLTWDKVFSWIASYIVVQRSEKSVSGQIAIRALESIEGGKYHRYIEGPKALAVIAALLAFPPAILWFVLTAARLDHDIFDTVKEFCTKNDLVKIELKKDNGTETAYWTLSDKGDLLAAQIKVAAVAHP